MLFDIGCYTAPDRARGISTWRLTDDPRPDGRIEHVSVTPMDSPSWLSAHPTLPVVYAANETGDGTVTACRRRRDGALEVLGNRPTGGSFPCHLAITSGFLLASNYGSGSVSVFRLADDGGIGERTHLVEHVGHGAQPDRQEGPHVHMVAPAVDGSVRVVDLGLDQVVTYDLGDDGRLRRRSTLRLPPGFGPRQVADLPDGRLVVVGELASQLAVVDHDQLVCTVGTTNLPAPAGNLPAQLIADGGRVLVSNRGANSVSAFAYADGALDRLWEVPVARGPRHFAVAADRLLVAAQDDGAVEVVRDGACVTRVEHPSPTFVLVSPHGTWNPPGGSVH